MAVTVGVLGLQGDFALHQKALKRIGVESRIVRYPEEMELCHGLILPGGESTTFIKLLRKTGLFDGVRKFAEVYPLMGTCAGLIVLATRITNEDFETLGLIDMEIERNSYGRQVDSFIDKIRIPKFKDKPELKGVFIRAPRIRSLGDGVEPMGFHGDDVVMARNERILAMTFHPELTKDGRIHRFFVEEMIG
jgi:5'-phosphate synthase pdxT subunit